MVNLVPRGQSSRTSTSPYRILKSLITGIYGFFSAAILNLRNISLSSNVVNLAKQSKIGMKTPAKL